MTPQIIIVLALLTLAAVLLPIALVLFFLYRIEVQATDARLNKRLAGTNETRAILEAMGQAVAPALQELVRHIYPPRSGPQIIEVTFADARAIMADQLVGKDGEHDCGYRANLAMLLFDKVGNIDHAKCNRIADDAINMLFGTDEDGQRARARSSDEAGN